MSARRCLPALLVVAAVAGGCASSSPSSSPPVSGAVQSGSATTVAGQVVSFTADSVTVETAGGRETVALTADTQGREHLIVGRRVSIEALSEGGTTVARRIAPDTGGG
jgi:hypothetical protein